MPLPSLLRAASRPHPAGVALLAALAVALEMAEGLELTDPQASALRDIEDRMRPAAQALGARILELEAELDRRFAHGHAMEDDVQRLSVALGQTRGELRAVHLQAHMETAAVLSAEQAAAYVRMRGYGGR